MIKLFYLFLEEMKLMSRDEFVALGNSKNCYLMAFLAPDNGC